MLGGPKKPSMLQKLYKFYKCEACKAAWILSGPKDGFKIFKSLKRFKFSKLTTCNLFVEWLPWRATVRMRESFVLVQATLFDQNHFISFASKKQKKWSGRLRAWRHRSKTNGCWSESHLRSRGFEFPSTGKLLSDSYWAVGRSWDADQEPRPST